MNNQLQHLTHKNPHMWLDNEAYPESLAITPSGYSSLDAILPGSGWPPKGVFEVITPYWSFGELQLLLPLIKSVTKLKRRVLLVAPPHVPYAHTLRQLGVDIDYLESINSDTSCIDTVKRIEKTLQSDHYGLVITWLSHLPNALVKRLEIASSIGNTLAVLFRNQKIRHSPAKLQIQLKHTSHGLHAHVIKKRGSDRYRTTTINLPFH